MTNWDLFLGYKVGSTHDSIDMTDHSHGMKARNYMISRYRDSIS